MGAPEGCCVPNKLQTIRGNVAFHENAFRELKRYKSLQPAYNYLLKRLFNLVETAK